MDTLKRIVRFFGFFIIGISILAFLIPENELTVLQEIKMVSYGFFLLVITSSIEKKIHYANVISITSPVSLVSRDWWITILFVCIPTLVAVLSSILASFHIILSFF